MVLNITEFNGCAINLTLLAVIIGLSLRFELFEAKPLASSLNEENNYTILGSERFESPYSLRNSETLKQQQRSNIQTVGAAITGYYQQQSQQQQHQKQLPDNYLNDLGGLGTRSLLQSTKRVENATIIATTTTPSLSSPSQATPHGASLRKALLSLQNPRLLGGDILIRTGRKRKDRLLKYERSALVSPVSLWPNGVIYYELHPSVAHLEDLLWKVMQQFHDGTCIRFIPRQHNEPDFLHIEAIRGCFSYIGRIGGEQTLSLGDGCEYKGTIAHELLHAVGFYHHQNRSDREDFLEIVWENIATGKENQFHKMEPQENTLLNEFDFDSIMLYGPHTFGKTLDKVTMKPKREGVVLLEVVEKQGLSLLDIDSVNKLYKCKPYDERLID